MYQLRPYQIEMVRRARNEIKNGHHSIIVCSPPRTGKTVIMSAVAKSATDKGNRVLFLIHRKEVLDQAVQAFHEQGVNPSMLTAGMVQTLTRHVDQIQPPQLILVDEAHHSNARSYQRILKAFPKAYRLLFTATPIRTGRKQMDQVADDIIVGKSIRELTREGYLAPFRYFEPPEDLNWSLLKKSSTGDFTQKSIDQVMTSAVYGHVVKQYQRLASGKQAVVYASSISHAKSIAKKFNDVGISAHEVDGETPATERDAIVESFRQQRLMVLVNVNLFTEGVDLPNVDCVIMARPTASLSLYLQFSMRCLNPRKGKTAIIIDHVKNSSRFGYPDDDRDWAKAIHTRNGHSPISHHTSQQIATITCDHCFAVVRRNEIPDGKCPICGQPIKVPAEITVQDVDLVERKQAKKRRSRITKLINDKLALKVATKTIGELTSMAELRAYAKLRGYKPGWVYLTAKRKGILH